MVNAHEYLFYDSDDGLIDAREQVIADNYLTKSFFHTGLRETFLPDVNTKERHQLLNRAAVRWMSPYVRLAAVFRCHSFDVYHRVAAAFICKTLPLKMDDFKMNSTLYRDSILKGPKKMFGMGVITSALISQLYDLTHNTN